MNPNQPYFGEEPTMKCPVCNTSVHAEWCDIGFGPYSQQVGPYHCSCGWVEDGCPSDGDLCKRCKSWDYCKGEALRGKLNERISEFKKEIGYDEKSWSE